jgi:hypothetical protein
MALTSTEVSLCDKMLSDYYGIIAPVKAAKAGIIAQKNALQSQLAGQSYTPPSTLAQKLNEFRDSVGAGLPDATDINSIKRMLDNCDYFNNLGGTSAIAGTLKSSLDGIASKISNFGATTGEFNAAKIASALNQALSSLIPGGSALTDIIKKASSLIECLSSVCAAADPTYTGGIDSIIGDFHDTLDGMGLVDDPASANFGKMNYADIYSQAGMTLDQISAIEITTATVDSQKLRAKQAIDDTIASIKASIPISTQGFF